MDVDTGGDGAGDEAAEGVLDRAIVEELREIGALAEALALYRVDAPATAEALAMASGAETRRLAHGLRGASVNLGCVEVAAVCAEMERADGPAGAAVVARLEAAIARAVAALDRALGARG